MAGRRLGRGRRRVQAELKQSQVQGRARREVPGVVVQVRNLDLDGRTVRHGPGVRVQERPGAQLGQSLGPVGAFLLGGGDLADADRELLILRTCALAGAEYEWGVHAVGYARRAGLDDELIEATACLPTHDPRWTARELRLLRLVDEAESSVSVSDELWDDLASLYTDAQLLELLLVAGFYRYVALTARATRTPLEPWAKTFPDRRLSSR